MKPFDEWAFEKVLSSERTARYYLLELTMRGCTVSRPISELTYDEVKVILRTIMQKLEAREAAKREAAE